MAGGGDRSRDHAHGRLGGCAGLAVTAPSRALLIVSTPDQTASLQSHKLNAAVKTEGARTKKAPSKYIFMGGAYEVA
jgi:hypothetical protein